MDISKHPLLKECYELCLAIEACGASPELTAAVTKASELMRGIDKMVTDSAQLRGALVGLVGADTEQELRQMEAQMRILPAPEADKAVSINAIHALLATMTPHAGAQAP